MNISKIRDKIKALEFQKRVIESQPRTRADVEAVLTETMARYEAVASINMQRAVAQLAAGQHASPFTVHGMTAHGPVSIDLGPMFTSLLGTASMLESMQAALKSVPEGLPATEAANTLAGIVVQLDKLHTDEEKLIRESEADGCPVPRRTGADPRYELAL